MLLFLIFSTDSSEEADDSSPLVLMEALKVRHTCVHVRMYCAIAKLFETCRSLVLCRFEPLAAELPRWVVEHSGFQSNPSSLFLNLVLFVFDLP